MSVGAASYGRHAVHSIGDQEAGISRDAEDLSFSVDLRSLSVRLSIDDGEPALVLTDGSQAMSLESIAGGSAVEAIAGPERLAVRSAQLASVLKVRAGSSVPLTPQEPVDDEPVSWRQPNGRPLEGGGDRRIRSGDGQRAEHQRRAGAGRPAPQPANRRGGRGGEWRGAVRCGAAVQQRGEPAHREQAHPEPQRDRREEDVEGEREDRSLDGYLL